MAIWQPLKGILELIHTVLGPAADVADLAKVFKGAGEAIKHLPHDVQARIRRGDAFSQFRNAMTKLDPREQDAVRKILARLRTDQAKQEYFILKAAAQGGLEDPQSTVDFLKYLATMDTDEALQDLEDTDTTQPSATIKSAKNKVVNGAKRVGTGVDAAVQNSGLGNFAENLRNKSETWAKK